MSSRSLVAALVVALAMALSSHPATASQLKKPTKTPVPTEEKHKAALSEGIALHDDGDYEGAAAKYRSVLAENPDDLTAMYELAFTYFTDKQYQKSLDVAYKAVEYESQFLPDLYALVGNNLDNLGKGDEAVKVYTKAIELHPDNLMLRFNLGVTHARRDEMDNARKQLKRAVTIQPDHPGSHYVLAQVYETSGYRVPALLAYSRFLLLEPGSPRSAHAVTQLRGLMSAGVSAGKKPNEINVEVNLGGKKDEGNFEGIEMMLPLLEANRKIEENKAMSESERFAGQVESFLAILDETTAGKKDPGFAWNYYVPYFAAMKRQGHAETFAYLLLHIDGKEDATGWLQRNRAKLEAMIEWSRAYSWPAVS